MTDRGLLTRRAVLRKAAALAVGAVIGMRSEVVAKTLDQVRRTTCPAVPVVIRQR